MIIQVQGSIEFDPDKQDLDGRIKEFVKDGYDDDDARIEALDEIVSELLGITALRIEDWSE